MIANADENDAQDCAVALGTIEAAWDGLLIGGPILITMMGVEIQCFFEIVSSMYDEKLDRKSRGMMGCGASYLCDYCTFRQRVECTDPALVGQGDSAQYRRTAQSDLAAAAAAARPAFGVTEKSQAVTVQGMSTEPALFFRPQEQGMMDATHADVNGSGNLIYKIIKLEIAALKTWSETASIKPQMEAAKAVLDEALCHELYLYPKLMTGGNFGRKLIEESSEPTFMKLIESPERRTKLKRLLWLWRSLRAVWRPSGEPARAAVRAYDANRRELHKMLTTPEDFGHVLMTPYLHMIIEHVPGWIRKRGSIGAYSCEPLEHSNKIYRGARRNNARFNVAVCVPYIVIKWM